MCPRPVWCMVSTVHHEDGLRALANLNATGGTVSVGWVSPAVSVILAAASLQWREDLRRIAFSSQCQDYASTVGLMGVLQGDVSPNPKMGNRCGDTYSPLASLSVHSEVEACNSLVNGVFRTALGTSRLVRDVCKVVGELHDNVASHAKGRGYSAA